MILKRHLRYDPKLDQEAKITELRVIYEQIEASKSKEDPAHTLHDDETSYVSENVAEYFRRERGGSPHQKAQ